jgi:hypothetical protein
MIRLFIYTVIRFLVVAFAVLIAFRIFKWIVRVLQRKSGDRPYFWHSGSATAPKKDYKDVREASFTDLSDKEDREKKEK